MYDVIIIGAGPAGSATAKRCAENELHTLILEKQTLPRDKVCSGMLLRITRNIIEREFGSIPENIFCQPSSIAGSMLYIDGLGSQDVPMYNALTWRRNLDYWLNQKAQAKGAEIWTGARVTDIKEEGQGLIVEIEKDKNRQQVTAKYVVGADGANSITRSIIFPAFKTNFQQAYEELYNGDLKLLDKKHYHSFRSLNDPLIRFGVHQKDNQIIIVVAGRVGDPMQKLMDAAKEYLVKNYQFDREQKLASKDGCVEPLIHNELASNAFVPAKGNILLVGDAGGFINPMLGEGISVGIRSALCAADAIIETNKSKGSADINYLKKVEHIITMFKEALPMADMIAQEVKNGGKNLIGVSSRAMNSIVRLLDARLGV